MELVGFCMALVVGVTLGLMGSGGSIIAVPVLAYLFSFDEKIATAYSLFIVGSAALVGGLQQNKNRHVDWRTAIVFGIPSVLGVWLVRYFIVPELPDVLFEFDQIIITRRMGIFGLFSLLMIWAAYSMLFSSDSKGGSGVITYNYPLIVVQGLLVGGLSGFVGAGGGFLIVPALVILANLEIMKAIGTSLIIVAIKSILGFLLADALMVDINWNFLLIFTLITIVGIYLGVYLGNYIDKSRLKKVFGYFILGMAGFVFMIEFLIKP